jgi:hypothetical protein
MNGKFLRKAVQIAYITNWGDRTPDGVVKEPGEYVLCENPPGNFGIHFRCPCGCGRRDFIPIRPGPYSGNNRDPWGWDGNKETPTVFPSIYNKDTCGWHGWLENGEWRQV